MKNRAEISSTALALAVATLLCAPIFARPKSFRCNDGYIQHKSGG